MHNRSNDKGVSGRKAAGRKQSSLKHTIEAAKAAVSLSTTEPNSLMRPVQCTGNNTLQRMLQYKDNFKGGSLNAPSIRGAVAFSDSLGQYKCGSSTVKDRNSSNIALLKLVQHEPASSVTLSAPVLHEDLEGEDALLAQTVARQRRKLGSVPSLISYEHNDWFPPAHVFGTQGNAVDLPKGCLLGSVFDMGSSITGDSRLHTVQVRVSLPGFPMPITMRNAHHFFAVAYLVAPGGEPLLLGRSETCQGPSLQFNPGFILPYHPHWHLSVQFDVYMVVSDQVPVLAARSKLCVCQLVSNNGLLRYPAVFSSNLISTLKLKDALVAPLRGVYDQNKIGELDSSHQHRLLSLNSRSKEAAANTTEPLSSDLPILVSKLVSEERVVRPVAKMEPAVRNIEGSTWEECIGLWASASRTLANSQQQKQHEVGRLAQEPCSFCFTMVGAPFPMLNEPPKCQNQNTLPSVKELLSRPPGSTVYTADLGQENVQVSHVANNVPLKQIDLGDDKEFDLTLLASAQGAFLVQVHQEKLKDGAAMTPGSSAAVIESKGHTTQEQVRIRSVKFIQHILFEMQRGVLNLALRGLGPGAASLVADWLLVEGVKLRWKLPLSHTPCTVLDLSFNLVGDQGLRCLAEAVRVHPALQQLSIAATGTTAHTTVREGSTALCCILDALGGSVAAQEEKIEGKSSGNIFIEPQQLEIRKGALDRVNFILAQNKQVTLPQWSSQSNRSVSLLDISGSVPEHVPVQVKVQCNNRKDLKNGVGVSHLGTSGSKSQSRLLINSNTLTHLGLRNTGLGLFQGSADQLSIGLGVNQSLRQLDLAGNKLLPSHVAHICSGLSTRTNSYLDQIRGVNYVVSQEAKAEIDLNELENNSEDLHPGAHVPCIHKISFASNSLGDIGVEHVCTWAMNAPNLQTLDLTEVGMTANGMHHVQSLLNSSQCVLRELMLNRNILHATATSGLGSLTDNSQQVDENKDESASTVGEKPAKNKKLVSLHPEAVYANIQALFMKSSSNSSNNNTANGAQNPSLPPLLKPKLALNTHLEVISQSNCSIDDVFVVPLLQALGQCTSLVHLDLSCNRIRCVGAAAIAKHLLGKTAKPALKVLDLHSNAIGDSGGIAIAKELHLNKSLTSLYLHNNHLGTHSAGALLTALSLNETLVHCNVLANRMPFEKFKRLDKLASMNQKARHKNIVAAKLVVLRELTAQKERIPLNIAQAQALHEKKQQLQTQLATLEKEFEDEKVSMPAEKLPLQEELSVARQTKEAVAREYIAVFPDDNTLIQELVSNTSIVWKGPSSGTSQLRRGSNPLTSNALTSNITTTTASATQQQQQTQQREERRGSASNITGPSSGTTVIATRSVLDELTKESELLTQLKQQKEYMSSYLSDFLTQLEQDLREEEARTPGIHDLENFLQDTDDDDDDADIYSDE